MRVRATVVAAVVMLGAAGGPSALGASTARLSTHYRAPQASVSRAAAIITALRSPSTAWLARFLGPSSPQMSRDIALHVPALRRAELPRPGQQQAGDATAQEMVDYRYADLWPIDDYDHDGHVDFVGIDAHYSGSIDSPYAEYRITTVNGVTGKVMSTMERSGQGLYVNLVSVPVGKTAAAGLLLLEYRMASGSFRLSAHDGRGHTLWSSAPAPTIDGQAATLSLDGIVANRGKASDVLVHWTYSPARANVGVGGVAQNIGATITQVGVVAGATGAVQARGSQLTTVNFLPQVFAGPDLDADGHDDTIVATGAVRHGGTLDAYSGLSGTKLWQVASVDVPYFFEVWAIPTTLGSSRADVMTWAWETGDDDPRLAPVTGGGSESVTCTVVDGATGTSGYATTHSGMGFCFPIGDADGDHRQELFVDSLSSSPTAATYSISVVSPQHKRVIWVRPAKITADFSGSSFVSSFSSTLGDLQPDGVPELSFALVVSTSADGKVQQRSGSYDGRTGHDLKLPADTVPLFASLDGAGDDLARYHAKGRTTTLAVLDGRTRRPMGTYTITLASASDGLGFYALSTSKGCVRQLVVVDYEVDRNAVVARSVTVLDSASARARLRVAPNGARPAPLSIRRSGPRQHCSH